MKRQIQADSDVLDVREAAGYLKFSRRKLYDLVRRGVVPHKRIGRQYRFSRPALAAWLSGPSVGTGAVREAPLREPTDEELLREVAATENDFKKHLLFVALLTRALARRGKSCVVVGGHAAEYYTDGGYKTGDIDLVCGARDDLHEVLTEWGFTKLGFTWSHKDMDIHVEAPAGALPAEERERVLRVEVKGLVAYYYGIEDLTVDRLNACVHWKSPQDGLWAKDFLKAWWDKVEWDYLRRRCDREGTREDLERLVGEIEKERL